MQRRDFLKSLAAAGSASLLSCRGETSSSQRGRRMVVLAFDGMDPRLARDLMHAGRMPNLAKLAAAGSFKSLATSTPPHTPVAFANIITGAEAGVHQVYDFVHRDPHPHDAQQAVRPFFATSEAIPPKHDWSIPLGDFRLPLSSSSVVGLRRGRAFWHDLSEHGVDCDAWFLPTTFPPESTRGPGRFRCMSGMGTPDLLGTYGEFTCFDEDATSDIEQVSGGRFIRLPMKNHRGRATLAGPPDFLASSPQLATPLEVSIDVLRDPTAAVAKLDIAGQAVILQQGEWSGWQPLQFQSRLPGATTAAGVGAPVVVAGMVRFYLAQVHPTLKLYVSPINIDPTYPVQPISSPHELAPQLAGRHRFTTLGIPEDTKALSHGALNEREFLSQVDLVLDEHRREFRQALATFQQGCLFFYFGTTDLVQHMFWRDRDPDHPGRVAEQAAEFSHVIDDYYAKMDAIIGDAMEQLAADDTLLVLSDHGFTTFRRGVNVNTWLQRNRYMTFGRHRNAASITDVDSILSGSIRWNQTRAYALGLNAVYLNMQGRERFGVVHQSERRSLLRELSNKLLLMRDGSKYPISRVDIVEDRFPGADPLLAPDLILGYADGYRASWDTVLGGAPVNLLADNMDRWSGTHLIDPELVPGLVACNRPIAAAAPGVCDVAPTILDVFGIAKPGAMTGRSIFATT